MMTLNRNADLGNPDVELDGFALKTGAERRRGLRIAQERPIKVFEPASGRYYPGQTSDVSATGLRVEMPVSTPILPGKTLSVHVGLNQHGQSLANRRAMIPARVVWIDRSHLIAPSNESPKTMMLGLEFLSTTTAQLNAA